MATEYSKFSLFGHRTQNTIWIVVVLAQIFKDRPSGSKIVPSTLLFCTQKVMVAMVTKETEEEQWISPLFNKIIKSLLKLFANMIPT